MNRYALRAGEPLAISPDAIKRDADGFFFMMGPSAPENEERGSCVVVHVRGALSHFKTDAGDSYEAIIERVGDALARKPSHVVLRIDSPGGVVAGLNETVAKLRKMSKDAGIPLVAYIDEMAASAAYGACCACEEILAPSSAVVGSIGVISTMATQKEHDEQEGVRFVLITSGSRKADGHPHGEITDDAIEAERGRNAELAAQFFTLASEARGLTPKKIAALEAGVFLGKAVNIDDARDAGLIDEVISFDEAMAHLDTGEKPGASNEPLDRLTDSVSLTVDSHLRSESLNSYEDDAMSVKMQALIAKMAKETDPVKVSALLVEYGLSAKVEKPEGDDDDGEGEGDEDKHAKAAKKAEMSKKKAEAAKHKAAGDEYRRKAAECDGKARDAMGDEDGDEDADSKAIRASLGPVASVPAPSSAVAAATDALAKITQENTKTLTRIQADIAKREQSANIREALSDGRISPHEAKMLAEKSPTWAAEYIATREGVRVLNTGEGDLIVPKESGDVPSAEMKEINERIAAMGVSDPTKVEKLRTDMIANRRKAATNGAGSRY